MVNIGRPSRGCTTCIQRKIGCDRQQPACGQCLKGKRRCGGYRNETDLMFRDQTKSMSARFRASSESPAQGAQTPDLGSTRHMDTNVATGTRSYESQSPDITPSPKLNEEHGLISFYLNNFACSNHNRGTNLFWMPDNIDELLKNESCKLSIQSVGAMALARLQKSSYYFREAQKHYGLALISLAHTFLQELEVEKDAVLIAISCLSFFEILLSHDSALSRKSWMTHLGGLTHLLKKRDEKFFATEFGARMLLQSRSQIILNSLQTKTPIPEAFRGPTPRLQHSAQTVPPKLVPAAVSDILLARLATLQAHCYSSDPSDALMTQLNTLAEDFARWSISLPADWYFSRQPAKAESQFWWDIRQDVYMKPLVANVWNKIRTGRIIIHDLTQEMSLRLSSLDEGILKLEIGDSSSSAMDIDMRRLVTDICATIPSYYRPPSSSTEAESEADKPKLGTSFWYLWDLEVIGSMREAPRDLRNWAISCLQRIYETTGIVKAQVGANRVKAKLKTMQQPTFCG